MLLFESVYVTVANSIKMLLHKMNFDKTQLHAH